MGNQLLYGPNQVAEFPQAGPQAANDSVALNVPGRVIQYAGKKYRYVQFDNGSGNVAAVVGGVVYWKTLTPETGVFVVTTDETDSLGGINAVAGVIGAVVTDQYYTWIQVGGIAEPLVNASTVAGDKMIGYATDKLFNRIAAGGAVTDVVFGVALDAYDTAGTARVLLQNLEW